MTTAAVPGILVATATADARSAYLKKVLLLTLFGLIVAGVVGMASTLFIATHPSLLSGYGPMAIILGCWAITNFVARPMVFGARKWGGFLLGTAAEGVSLGFLLLVAIVISKQDYGNPFVLIGLALMVTILSGIGLATYAYSERREFSLLRAGLGAAFLPMLVLMAISFAFPSFLNGTAGLVVCGLFVLVSAAGLLYQLNRVIHDFTTSMHLEGAFMITIGLLVLFWNVLSLLSRGRRR